MRQFNTETNQIYYEEFSFDKNRQNFTKIAYRKCRQKKLFQLYDTFDFEVTPENL